mgnify:CR=1 FL=1
MPKEPIQELKEDVQKILPLLDQLRMEINASRQSTAAEKVEEIKTQLEELKRKVQMHFHWIVSEKQESLQKKPSFFGLRK